MLELLVAMSSAPEARALQAMLRAQNAKLESQRAELVAAKVPAMQRAQREPLAMRRAAPEVATTPGTTPMPLTSALEARLAPEVMAMALEAMRMQTMPMLTAMAPEARLRAPDVAARPRATVMKRKALRIAPTARRLIMIGLQRRARVASTRDRGVLSSQTWSERRLL